MVSGRPEPSLPPPPPSLLFARLLGGGVGGGIDSMSVSSASSAAFPASSLLPAASAELTTGDVSDDVIDEGMTYTSEALGSYKESETPD